VSKEMLRFANAKDRDTPGQDFSIRNSEEEEEEETVNCN
jgi:hypothetical protein